MPRHQLPEIIRNIEQRYGIRGPAGIDVIAPEIVPVTLVDDLTKEQAIQELVAIGAGGITSDPAQFATVQLYNPATSLVDLDVMMAYTRVTAQHVVYVEHGATFINNLAMRGLPIRARGVATGPVGEVHEISHATAPATGGTIVMDLELDGSRPDVLWQPWYLEPGDTLTVQNAVAQQYMGVSFTWTERPRVS